MAFSKNPRFLSHTRFTPLSHRHLKFMFTAVAVAVAPLAIFSCGPAQADTLGGLVQDRLGEIPDPGDSVTLDNITIEVLTTAGLRIKQLLVRRGNQPPSADHEIEEEEQPEARVDDGSVDLQQASGRNMSPDEPVMAAEERR